MKGKGWDGITEEFPRTRNFLPNERPGSSKRESKGQSLTGLKIGSEKISKQCADNQGQKEGQLRSSEHVRSKMCCGRNNEIRKKKTPPTKNSAK
jgi:hypothetical protein